MPEDVPVVSSKKTKVFDLLVCTNNREEHFSPRITSIISFSFSGHHLLFFTSTPGGMPPLLHRSPYIVRNTFIVFSFFFVVVALFFTIGIDIQHSYAPSRWMPNAKSNDEYPYKCRLLNTFCGVFVYHASSATLTNMSVCLSLCRSCGQVCLSVVLLTVTAGFTLHST